MAKDMFSWLMSLDDDTLLGILISSIGFIEQKLIPKKFNNIFPCLFSL
jgi:hypothetical protein